MKKWIVVSIIATVLLVGAVAYAADGLPFGGGFGYGVVNANPYHTVELNGVAKALGMTTDELYDELQSGKTVYQIADERGISEEEFTESLKGYNKDFLDTLEKEGFLTEEQADQIYEYQESYGVPGYGVPGFGGCPGPGYGPGRGAGYGPGMMYRYNQGF